MGDNTCRDTWLDVGVVTTGIDSTCIIDNMNNFSLLAVPEKDDD